MVQAQILELLTRLSDELGLAVVLVTHDLPVVAQMCGRAAVMYAGEIAETGPMETLYHDPQHPYTRLLFAATPDLYGEGDGDLDPRRAAAPGPRATRLRVPAALRRGDGPLCQRPSRAAPVGSGHLAACLRAGADSADLAEAR